MKLIWKTAVTSALMALGFKALAADIDERIDQPILSIKADVRSIPYEEQVIRDPLRPRFSNKKLNEIPKREQDLDVIRDKLAKLTAKDSKLSTLRLSYQKLYDLCDLYQVGASTDQGTAAKLQPCRRELLQLGRQLLLEKISTEERLTLHFQMSLQLIAIEEYRKSGIEQLRKLDQGSGMPPERLATLQTILSVEDALSNNKVQRREAVERLAKFSAQTQKQTRNYISLAMAQSLAGFDSKGVSLFPSESSYKQHLNIVSKLCNNASPEDINRLFDYSLSLWSMTEDYQKNPALPPFDLSCYRKAQQMPVLEEQFALGHIRQRNYEKALEIYNLILQNPRYNTLAPQLTWRKLLLLRSIAEHQPKGLDIYQQALIEAIAPSRGTPYQLPVLNLHKDFIKHEFRRVLQPQPRNSSLALTRERWGRFAAKHTDPGTVREMRRTFVQVLQTYGFQQEALQELIVLAQEGDAPDRSQALEQALLIYRKTYGWDPQNPWAKGFAVERNQLQDLEKILKMRTEIREGQSLEPWVYELQLGAIAWELDRRGEASERFQRLISWVRDQPMRDRCYTLLMKFHYQQKQWPALAQLSRQGIEGGWKLLDPNLEQIGLKGFLLLSLENQIKDALAARDQDSALNLCDELLKELNPSQKRNQYLELAANIALEKKQFARAIDHLQAMVNEKVQSEHYPPAILQLAKLRLQLGSLNQSAELYAEFVQRYPSDERANSIYDILGDLQLALGSYPLARQAYVNFLRVAQDSDQAEATAMKLLDVARESRNPDWVEADLSDKSLTPFWEGHPRARASFLAYSWLSASDSLKASQNLRGRPFTDEERELLPVSDLLTWKSLLEARAKSRKQNEDLQAKLLDNQSTALNNLQSSYRLVYGAYLQACPSAVATSCAPALSELLREIERFQSLATDLVLPEDAAAQEQLRKEFVSSLTQDAQTLRQRINDVIQSGNTDPRWNRKTGDGLEPSLWAGGGLKTPANLGYLEIPRDLLNQKEPRP